MLFTKLRKKASPTSIHAKIEGKAADTPSGVDWSEKLGQELGDAKLSYNPPNSAEFQGRRCTFFFITGVGKSGTNWLGNVLNLHPSVYVDPGEFQFQTLWNQGLKALSGPSWQSAHRAPYKQAAEMGMIDTVRRTLLAGVANKPGVGIIGDKRPRFFSVLVPGCPIINLVRDGRDVMVSYTYHYLRLQPGNMQWWNDDLKQHFPPFSERFHAAADDDAKKEVAAELLSQEWWLIHAADMWASRVKADRENIAKASVDSPETPVMILRYEDLHANFEAKRAEIYRFIGADPSLAEDPSEDSRTSPGFRKERVMGFYRKGQPGDWKRYRNEVFDRVVSEHVAESLLAEGYELETNESK